MLDTFKGLTRLAKAQKHSDDLHSLIAAAREERTALSAMLTQISMRATKLQQIAMAMEQVDQRASAANARLDAVVQRVETLEERARSFAHIDARVQSLIEAAAEAQQAFDRLLSPAGELHKHHESVHLLTAAATDTRATLDALKQENASITELRDEVRESRTEITQSVHDMAALRAEVDEMRRNALNGLASDVDALRVEIHEVHAKLVAVADGAGAPPPQKRRARRKEVKRVDTPRDR
jgi:uncharacterized coiled-coil DUF342 family protein